MKKWIFGLAVLAAAMFANPQVSAADGVKYIKITVKSAKLWPVKPSGHCWDPPCFGKKYQLPARGAADYQKYFEDKNFQMLCNPKSSVAPDALVEIKIGAYDVFRTDKINNNCTPEWNVSHVFRVSPNDPFDLKVLDNDGGAGIQVKTDAIGHYTAPSVPAELLKGGKLVLKSFGQVEEIVLEAQVVERPKIDPNACDGVYNVRIVEYEVKDKKENGKNWDWGFGKAKLPDVVIKLKIGKYEVTTDKIQDKTMHTFTAGASKTIAIKKGMDVNLEVLDSDLNKFDKIGQTAESDVCKLLTAGGKYTFSNFGQVIKVVVIFEKRK
ncbi:MAG: hypothetical protein H6728_08190 [Myxococcales bacterium]|nr:hypothetical protein [Myxococcales bacterium]MCB9643038.1 hypothetical protein [Myxococcales bacterium]